MALSEYSSLETPDALAGELVRLVNARKFKAALQRLAPIRYLEDRAAGYYVELVVALRKRQAYPAIGLVLGGIDTPSTLLYVDRKTFTRKGGLELTLFALIDRADADPAFRAAAERVFPALLPRVRREVFARELAADQGLADRRKAFLLALPQVHVEVRRLLSEIELQGELDLDLGKRARVIAKHVEAGEFDVAARAFAKTPKSERGRFGVEILSVLHDAHAYEAMGLVLGQVHSPAVLSYLCKKCLLPKGNLEAVLLALMDGAGKSAAMGSAANHVLPAFFHRANASTLEAALAADAESFPRRAGFLLGIANIREHVLPVLSRTISRRPDLLGQLDHHSEVFEMLDCVERIGRGDYSSAASLVKIFDLPDDPKALTVRLATRVPQVGGDAGSVLVCEKEGQGSFRYDTKLVSTARDAIFPHDIQDNGVRAGLASGSVFLPELGVLTPHGQLITEGAHCNEHRFRLQPQYLFTLEDRRRPDGPGELIKLPGESLHIPGRVMALGSNPNFFHFVVNYLPKLWFLDQAGADFGDDFKILLGTTKVGFHARFLEILGISRDRIQWAPENTLISADEFLVSGMPVFRGLCATVHGLAESAGYMHVSRGAVDVIRHKMHRGVDPVAKGRRIFLRRGEGSKRNLLNGQEVEATLVSLGFECIDPSVLPAAEQIALMREASMVAGPSGGQLGLLMYAPANAAFLELSPDPTESLGWFVLAAAAAGLRYYEVAGYVPSDNLRRVNADFGVDLALLRRAVRLAEDET